MPNLCRMAGRQVGAHDQQPERLNLQALVKCLTIGEAFAALNTEFYMQSPDGSKSRPPFPSSTRETVAKLVTPTGAYRMTGKLAEGSSRHVCGHT
ncbi:hypothetical protein CC2G_004155 [Coprinopsis cinerea AmutBmut pab1-1]|nr:hypothetical protein CC2G_004155 [Coprinopsis cinerea AmutBmut pab1-1]